MEIINRLKNIRIKISELLKSAKSIFIRKSTASDKRELNWASIKAIALAGIVLFVAIVLLLPTEQAVEFTEKAEGSKTAEGNATSQTESSGGGNSQNRDSVWAAPRSPSSGGGGSEVNHNTSMILGAKNGNAKTQVRAGLKMPLRILDKFIVSDSPVPILAELILATQTDSGLNLPAGTRFYGEASFGRSQERAQIRFTQISLPSGEIRAIQGLALGKDGQPGIEGRVYSDGAKNTAGQIITTFVAGLAAGTAETDMFGNSKGGLQNGLLTAVSATAKDRAQNYGEKLKAEREWIEVGAGVECDAIFSQSLNLQRGGDFNE